MDMQQPANEAVNKVVGDLQKDFKIVGTHRVHAWYAWAIVGIVFGMALGIIYVANRSVKVQESDAAAVRKPAVSAPRAYGSLPESFLKLIAKHEAEYGPIGRISVQNVVLAEENGEKKLNLSEPEIFRTKTGKEWLELANRVSQGLSSAAPLEVTLGPDQDFTKKTRPYLLIGPNARAFISIINSFAPAGAPMAETSQPKKQCKCEKIASAEFSMTNANGEKVYIIQVNKDADATEPFEFDTSLPESTIRKRFTEKKTTCNTDAECATTCKAFAPTFTYDDLVAALKSGTAKAKAQALKSSITTTSGQSLKDGEDNGKCQTAEIIL